MGSSQEEAELGERGGCCGPSQPQGPVNGGDGRACAQAERPIRGIGFAPPFQVNRGQSLSQGVGIPWATEYQRKGFGQGEILASYTGRHPVSHSEGEVPHPIRRRILGVERKVSNPRPWEIKESQGFPFHSTCLSWH